MINRRGWIVLAIIAAWFLFICSLTPPHAADNPQTLTCADVRAVVALFKGDVEKAVQVARDAGATAQQIAWAPKCLGP